jgi:hypothetical protein
MPSEQDLVRIGEQQRFESQRATVEAKLQTGQPLDIYEAIFLSHYYPAVSKQMARPVYGPPAPTSQPSPTYTDLRRDEYKSFGQLIGDVKSQGTTTLTEVLLGEREKSRQIEPFFSRVAPGLPKPGRSIGKAAGFTSGFESMYAPTPFELSPDFILGRGVAEVIKFYAFSWTAGMFVESIYALGSAIEETTGIKQKIVTSEPYIQFTKGFEKGKEFIPSAMNQDELQQGKLSDVLARHSDSYRRYIESQVSYGGVDVPDIGMTAPRTMSEKALGLPKLEAPYQLKGVQPIEAEAGALSFATVPRTGIYDPQVSSALDNPVTRQMFGLPSGLPPLDTSSIERASFLPKLLGLSGIIGPEIMQSQIAGRNAKNDLLTRNLPKIEAWSTLSLKPLTDLGLGADLSPISMTKQEQRQKLVLGQGLVPRLDIPTPTVPTPTPQPTPQIFKWDNRSLPDMPKMSFFMPRRKGKSWEKRYMWEFPVKGPKEMWKAV